MPGQLDSAAKRFVLEAEEKARNYDWTAAAELYEKATASLGADAVPVDAGNVIESLAKSRYKNAFQARNREEFKQRMRLAKESFERALGLYEKGGLGALVERARARILFTQFWLSDDYVERRRLVEQAIPLADKAAKGLEAQGDRRGLAEAHLDLLGYSAELCMATVEWQVVKKEFERTTPIADRLLEEFEGLGLDEDLAESLMRATSILTSYTSLVEPSNPTLSRKVWEYGKQFSGVSGRTKTPLIISLAKVVAVYRTFFLEEKMADSVSLYQEAIEAAEPTNDSYYLGSMLTDASERAYWAGCAEEGDRRREIFNLGIEWGQRAVKLLAPCWHVPTLEQAYTNWAANHTWNAFFAETQAENKIEHFKAAVDIARKGRQLVTPGAPWTGSRDVLSKALVFWSNVETDPEKKRELLMEALPIREETVQTQKILGPGTWNLGVFYNYLALNRAELSHLTSDPKTRVEQLRDAISAMEQCVDLCGKSAAVNPVYKHSLGRYQEWYGDILSELYQLTRETDAAQRAVEVYRDAGTNLSKFELTAPVATLGWKAARIYDEIGDHRRASQSFNKAGRDFRLAAEKIPALTATYEDLSSYMESWSQIEEARLHHTQEEYQAAAENYSKAASILQQTKTRSHLSNHYLACSLLEKGEALSREEKQEASAEAYSEALRLFQDASSKLEEKLRKKTGEPDRRELKEWLDITKGRENYSRARSELEEARVLDKKGEEQASSAKYHSAYEAFRRLLSEAGSEQTRREVETLMLFCEAWAKMKRAESEASPELYAEAASSFTRAREFTTLTKFRLLAMANSSMCKALEAGTRFRHSRDIQLYGEIKKRLESAADQYDQAGFKNAGEWTRATQAMFDALAYMSSAEVELEPRKKTEFYRLAERHLDLAAKLYREAGFQAKSEEALRHLKRARLEKEILVTPVEVLAESPAVAGAVVAPVSLIRDHAAGLEKYEVAHVVGNVSLHQKESGVGSDVTVELEMANVGKTAATLIKLENIAPEGLQLDRQNIPHRVEDNYIDMKGKRLEYLKTHEVKVPMKAVAKGTFQIQPRVLFVDERGTYQSYEFEPVALTVRELGIKAWLKGPGTK